MLRSQRRLLALLAGLPVLLALTAGLYMWGMSALEGEPRGFWRALEWAAETLSTTGYGADAVWKHPAMILFVVVLQFAGVFLIFLIFPVYLIPFLEERFEARLPTEAPKIEDHLLIYRSGPAVATLLDQVRAAGLPALVIEEDEGEARRLLGEGHRVLFGSLREGVLLRARLDRARALIANSTDDEDAAIILAARQLGFRGDILALVEEPYHRQPMMLAGASAVYTPRHILGAALAARASERISPTVAGVQRLGRKLQIRELKIGRGSPLAGKTLAEAGIGAATGATVIGQWVGGRLLAPPPAGMRLEPDGILIVAGGAESLERLEGVCEGALSLRRRGPFVVGGYGEVGKKVVELLRDAGEEVRVIDRDPQQGVDLAGDMLDYRLLEEARVQEAQAVILALDTDSATLFATVILKDLAPEVPVIARVSQAENVERIHRAGADFALSISQVSGQMLARRLLGEEAVSVDPQLKVLKVAADGLVGRHPAELRIREETGCSVVAVERDEEVIVEFGLDFRFQPADTVYVCGSSEATRRYLAQYG